MHAPREEAMQDPDGMSRRGGSSRSRVTKCDLAAQEFAKGDHRGDFSVGRRSASFSGKVVGESNCELGRAKMDTHGVGCLVSVFVCGHQEAGVH